MTRTRIWGNLQCTYIGGLTALRQDLAKLVAHFQEMPTHHVDVLIMEGLANITLPEPVD